MSTWTVRVRATDRSIYTQVRDGLKRVETRAATPRYQKVAVGDTLIFVCGSSRLTKRITRVTHFKSIDAMLKKVALRTIMPSIRSVKEMRAVYAGYPGYAEKIKQHGIVAWHIK